MKRAILGTLAILVLVALAVAGWLWREQKQFVETPFGEGTRTVLIPSGTRPHALAKLLARGRVVSDEQRFYLFLHFLRRDAKPRSGEYEFDGPLTPDDVLEKLEKGEVKLYRFTVPEGLRADEIAPIVGRTGLCPTEQFLALARDPNVARKLNVPLGGNGLEGFLFPDTYSVPRTAGCMGIVQAMVDRFQHAWKAAQAQRAPDVKLNELQAVTLASIVEKETGQPEERPRVSCVFHNRLRKNMRLGTDPTVIYSVLLLNDFKWDGNLHKSDLLRPHPYNTYAVAGLPPGPIASPGAAALAAALHPLVCSDLFFVSRNDHTHVFCPDLACHEKAVQKWQVEYFKKKRNG